MMNVFTKFLCRTSIAIFLLPWFGHADAQRVISGKVTDNANGEAIIGAFVVSKQDNSVGTVTDFDGMFSLEVPQGTTSLVISFLGFQTEEIMLSAADSYQISMKQQEQLLKDVVIIGYGSVKKEDATGALQSVSAKDFNKGAITSPQELIAGKVAGVSVTTAGGAPDDGVVIRIRGESSLSASNDPLIVVDGIPLGGGISGNRNALNFINPNDIESMTVLKDASATAIYGSRASAGVILITTKKGGGLKKLRVDYGSNVSLGVPVNRVDVLSSNEFREQFSANFPDFTNLLGTANTDWQNEIFRPAFGHDHNLSASGIVGTLPYRVSVGYTNKDGILKTDNFERYSGALNLNPSFLNNTLRLNIGVRGMLTNNQFADRGAIGSAVNFDPTQPVLDPDSRYSGYFVWTNPDGSPKPLAPANPVSLLNLRDDRSVVKRYVFNGSADYRLPFLPALRANLNLAYDYSIGEGSVSVPGENQVAFSYDPINGGGVNNTYSAEAINSLFEFYLNYQESFGDHNVDLMGGYSWQRFYNNNSDFRSNAAGTESETFRRENIASELYLLSLFTRLNYSYKNNFLLTLSLRGDATSRFAPENRWGLFPAAAMAYKFIDNNNATFNNLKLRLGFGVTGQQEIGGRYVYQATYQLSQDNAQYQFGEEFINTFRPNGYDRNIKWEETTTYNAGVDLSIVRNRLGATVDVFRRNTRDLLNFIPVPAGTNLTNFIFTNIGNMFSEGVELSLNTTPVIRKKMQWDLSANIAYNRFRVTKLTATEDPDYLGVLTGGISGGVGSTIQIHSVNYSPSSFFVFEQKYDENGKMIPGEYVDRNADGKIDENDKYRYKKPFADYVLGLTSNFRYGNLDFSFAGRANIGNFVYNNVATDLGYFARMRHPTDYLVNVHQSAVDNNIPAQVIGEQNILFSDHFVTDASFFRMDHITIGYNFNKVLGDFMRVYATVQNAFVLTRYTGIDPEIFNGIDNNFYPRPRTFLVGVNVSF
jgi:TonB-dependent starch-binding outer membrane protein SusC